MSQKSSYSFISSLLFPRKFLSENNNLSQCSKKSLSLKPKTTSDKPIPRKTSSCSETNNITKAQINYHSRCPQCFAPYKIFKSKELFIVHTKHCKISDDTVLICANGTSCNNSNLFHFKIFLHKPSAAVKISNTNDVDQVSNDFTEDISNLRYVSRTSDETNKKTSFELDSTFNSQDTTNKSLQKIIQLQTDLSDSEKEFKEKTVCCNNKKKPSNVNTKTKIKENTTQNSDTNTESSVFESKSKIKKRKEHKQKSLKKKNCSQTTNKTDINYNTCYPEVYVVLENMKLSQNEPDKNQNFNDNVNGNVTKKKSKQKSKNGTTSNISSPCKNGASSNTSSPRKKSKFDVPPANNATINKYFHPVLKKENIEPKPSTSKPVYIRNLISLQNNSSLNTADDPVVIIDSSDNETIPETPNELQNNLNKKLPDTHSITENTINNCSKNVSQEENNTDKDFIGNENNVSYIKKTVSVEDNNLITLTQNNQLESTEENIHTQENISNDIKIESSPDTYINYTEVERFIKVKNVADINNEALNLEMVLKNITNNLQNDEEQICASNYTSDLTECISPRKRKIYEKPEEVQENVQKINTLALTESITNNFQNDEQISNDKNTSDLTECISPRKRKIYEKPEEVQENVHKINTLALTESITNNFQNDEQISNDKNTSDLTECISPRKRRIYDKPEEIQEKVQRINTVAISETITNNFQNEEQITVTKNSSNLTKCLLPKKRKFNEISEEVQEKIQNINSVPESTTNYLQNEEQISIIKNTSNPTKCILPKKRRNYEIPEEVQEKIKNTVALSENASTQNVDDVILKQPENGVIPENRDSIGLQLCTYQNNQLSHNNCSNVSTDFVENVDEANSDSTEYLNGKSTSVNMSDDEEMINNTPSYYSLSTNDSESFMRQTTLDNYFTLTKNNCSASSLYATNKVVNTCVMLAKKNNLPNSFGLEISNDKASKINRSAKKCPSFKVISGTPFAVDAFSYGYLKGVTKYFLTHFHSDHYQGIHMYFKYPIYCSGITARLLKLIFKIPEQRLVVLEKDSSYDIDGIKVWALDANHCPGSLMFLFQLPTKENILHVGDFRATQEMESLSCLWNLDIDRLYLDTTYCSNEYTFPSQDHVLSDAKIIVRDYLSKRPKFPKALVICGTYTIGKEKIWLQIASKYKCKVWANDYTKQILNCLEDDEINNVIGDIPEESKIHLLPLKNINYEYLKAYRSKFSNVFDHIIALRPSGWRWKAARNVSCYKNNIKICDIPYSEHSSFEELARFVTYIKPKQVIPTVITKRSPSVLYDCFKTWCK